MRNTFRVLLENAVIVAGILSFWPWVFGYRGAVYQLGLIGVVAGLAVLAVVRFLRVKGAIEQMKRPLDSAEPASQCHPRK